MSCRDTEEGSPTERASSFQHTHYDNVLISLLARLQVRTICYFVRFREQLDVRPIVVTRVYPEKQGGKRGKSSLQLSFNSK